MIKIGSFVKNSSAPYDTSCYSLEQKNYTVVFLTNQFKIETVVSEEKKYGFFKKIANCIKSKVFNIQLSNDNISLDQKKINIYLKNSNVEPYSYIKTTENSSLLYCNIYNGIDLKCTVVEDNIVCDFILSQDSNPKDINLSFDDYNTVVLDDHNNLKINLNESNIIFKKPLYKNYEIDYILEQSIKLNFVENKELNFVLDANNEHTSQVLENTPIETNNLNLNSTSETEELSNEKAYNIEPIFNIQSNPYDLSNYSEHYFIGERNLTIPVSKTKFRYPRDFTTDLISSFSVPIVEELLVSRHIETSSSDYDLCDSSQPPVKIFTTYNVDSIIPTVSFSVVLYKNPYPGIDLISDINPYDGIFGYIEDNFVGDSIYLCNTTGNAKYYPADYSFVPIQPKRIDYISENDEYYFYGVTLDIYLYPTPPIQNLSPEVTQIINSALGKNPSDPITPGELSQITEISFHNQPSVTNNPSIFSYMPNLVSLDLSSCNVNPIFMANLASLPNLESLDLSNNPAIDNLDYIPKSLAKTLKCLDVSFTQSTYPPCESAYTTFISNPLSKITDVTPLAIFTLLESLKLNNQAISDLSSIYNLIQDGNLQTLLVNNQEIDLGSIYPNESICSSSCDFSLKVDFLKNIYGARPTILCISHNGYCYSLESGICYPCDSCDQTNSCGDSTTQCNCDYIIWEDININTDAYFTFDSDVILDSSEITLSFSGVVNVTLEIND